MRKIDKLEEPRTGQPIMSWVLKINELVDAVNHVQTVVRVLGDIHMKELEQTQEPEMCHEYYEPDCPTCEKKPECNCNPMAPHHEYCTKEKPANKEPERKLHNYGTSSVTMVCKHGKFNYEYCKDCKPQIDCSICMEHHLNHHQPEEKPAKKECPKHQHLSTSEDVKDELAEMLKKVYYQTVPDNQTFKDLADEARKYFKEKYNVGE